MDIGKLATDEIVAEMPFGDDMVVKVRFVTREKLAEILRRSTKITFNPKTHLKEEKIDQAEANRLLGEAAVVGWSGITSNGSEFPYTEANRDLLMTRWGDFVTFVNGASSDLARLVETERDNAKKNSATI